MVTMSAPPAFELVSGSLALDFVNSQDRSVGKPPIEKLHAYGDLLAWSAATASLTPNRLRALARAARARPDEADAVLVRARTLREAAYRVFAACVHGESPDAVELEVLNRGLAEAMAHARLVPKDTSRAPRLVPGTSRAPRLVPGTSRALVWSWDPDPDALDAPLWPVARAVAELLTAPELALVRECASETCLWLFLDTTRNHQRRWCDMRVCGNRAKVRAHRQRRRESERHRP